MVTQSQIFKKANELIREGYPRKQAFAIAYSEMGEPKRAKHKPAPKRKTAARTQRAAVGYVNRPSQITKKPPTNRLKKRRTINLQSPRGVFPNPSGRLKWDEFGEKENRTFQAITDHLPGGRSQFNIHKTLRGWELLDFGITAPYWTPHGAFKTPQSAKSFAARIVKGGGKMRSNPSSVHFDIDVNSHNARGAKARTRVNPMPRKEIKVSAQSIGREWRIIAKFPDTPQGAKDAIEYAKAYHVKNPSIRIKVES